VANNRDVAVVSASELRDIRSKLEKGPTNNAAIITRADLDRIKAETVIKTTEEIKAERKVLNAQKEAQFMENTKRKERMSVADKMRTSQMPKMTNTAPKGIPGADNLLSKAMEQMDENLDDVKHMNHLMLQSKVVTIRDMQLNENKRLEEEWLAEQKRLDIMMEIERLKGIREEHVKEQKKSAATRRAAEQLVDQIRERDVFRQQQDEILEKEKVQMKLNIKKAMDEEKAKVQDRQQRMMVMSEEIKKANKAAIELKEEAKNREKELEEKIMEHQRQKIAREEADAREARRVREEKERETQRLREL